MNLDWIKSFLPSKSPIAEKRNISGIEQWVPSPTLAGVTVTPETSTQSTTVYACVDLIATTVASLPFLIYRKLPNGGKAPEPDYYLEELLRCEPNHEMDAFSFWHTFISYCALYGNGLAEIERNWDGTVKALWLLDSRTTSLKRDSVTNQLYYESVSRLDDGRSYVSRLLAENVFHIKCLGTGLWGYSPIYQARLSIGNALAAETAGAAALGHSTTMAGILTTPEELDDQAHKTLRENLAKVHQGPYNAGKIAILEGQYTYQPLTIDLESLQFIETMKYGSINICRMWRVPPHKIGELDRATFSNIEEQNIDFAQNTIKPWCVRIEHETRRKLLMQDERRTLSAHLNMHELQRGNSEAQVKYLTGLFGLGALDVNQVCSESGLNPIGADGDGRYVSTNLQRLSLPAPDEVDTVEDTTDEIPTGDTIQEISLNGAQIASLLSIVADVVSGVLPRSAAKAVLAAAFPTMKPERIDAIIDPIQITGVAPAPPAADPAVEAVRNVVLDTAHRCVTKEVGAIRRAIKRPDFPAWLGGFYADHTTFLLAALEPSYRALAAVTGKTLDTAAIVNRLVETSTRELTETTDIAAVLTSWESAKAQIILEACTQ